ncbi:hypothetical protein ACFYUY_05640 [Kitasatospora sp. NPDC004745]|uniref:hypothetical protein n=1 Tax=Kitasatospora sp. NPDC004745 TaxID=3364019 RepID=UPI0036CDA1C9
MIVSLSTAVLFAIISVVLIRGRHLSLSAAVVLWLSGFTAASTGISGPVNDALTALVQAVSGH